MRKPVLILLASGGFAVGALPALGATDQHVLVEDFAYAPATRTITTGDTVVWDYGESTAYAHNVKFSDNSFTAPVAPSTTGWPVQRTFNTPGTFTYYCVNHGDAPYYMRGTIVVQDPSTTQTTTTTDATPTPTPGPTQTQPAPTTSTPTQAAAEASGLTIKRAVK